MKRSHLLLTAMLAGILLLAAVTPAHAWYTFPGNRPFLHWCWENDHATVVNAQLLTSNDRILQHHECFVTLAREYSQRDPLFNVYRVRLNAANTDTEMDAFLVGMKANNLIYLIHVADRNPTARAWAIRDLKLMGRLVDNPKLNEQFTYWASLLENRSVASSCISHQYVHYTIDISESFSDRVGYNTRYRFVQGYLINDFLVAHMVGTPAWQAEDQRFLTNLYSVRRFWDMDRYPTGHFWRFTQADLSLQNAADEAVKKLDAIVRTNTDRRMGDKPYRSNQ